MKGLFRRLRFGRELAVGLMVTVVAGGVVGVLLQIRKSVAVFAALPPLPSSENISVALRAKFAVEERRAGDWLHPVDGLKKLSRLYHANGFFDEALQCYEALHKLEPAEPRWCHLEADILAGFGRVDEAVKLWRDVVALSPEYVPALVKMGDALLKGGRGAEAEAVYLQVLRVDPGNPYASVGLARQEIAADRWIEARDRLRDTARRNPNFVAAISLLVIIAEHLGEAREAAALNAAIGGREFREIPDPWRASLWDDCYDPYQLSVAASAANFAEDRTTAVRLLERAIDLDPEAGSYRRQLGRIYFDAKDYLAARRYLAEAVAHSPVDADAWLYFVRTLTAIGNGAEVERALAEGLSACPNSAGLHSELARRLSASGHHEEAVLEFEKAHDLWPSEASPLVELAGAYFTVHRSEEALAALHEALLRQPDHPMALVTLTFYYIKSNDLRGATEWWQRVKGQPRTPQQALGALRREFKLAFGHPPP